jgi:NADH-quinone oxidoreductase subunit M
MAPVTLSALIAIPLLGGVLAWLVGRHAEGAARWIALVAAIATFVLSLSVWFAVGDVAAASATPVVEQRAAWIPSLGVEYHLALDGLNLLFVVLSGLLGCVAVLTSWREIERSPGLHYLCVLATLSGIMGVFLAFDLFLFYFFWELMLVPMYFLIGIWGHEQRIAAAIKFVTFTMASGLLLLVSIIGLYYAHAQASGVFTTDYLALLGTEVAPDTAQWLFLGFFVAFAVKLPLFPFHSWLPDAHTQAPTAGSILLAGLLLKTGGYGLIRFAVPLFPEAAASLAGPIAVLGVIGIVYGAVLAYGQTDMKRLIAYTSVSHMGFVVLAIAVWRLTSLQGAVFQMLAHGLATGALFAIAGMIHERLHTREFSALGGLWTRLPRLSGFALLFVLASVGVPGMGNFIGEFLTLLGSFPAAPELVAVAVIGIVVGTVAMLELVQRVFHGPSRSPAAAADLGGRELLLLAALALLVLLLGLYPQPALDSPRSTLDELVVRDVRFEPADPESAGRRTRTAMQADEGIKAGGGRP